MLIARSKRGYVSLSRLVTACHLGEPRGFPMATWERFAEHSTDLLCLTGGDVGPLDRLIVRRDFEGAARLVERLVSVYGRGNVLLEVDRSYMPWSMAVERRLVELAEATRTTAVAGGAVTHAKRSHYPAQDVLLCAESLCLLDDVIGRKARRHPSQPQAPRYPDRSLNAERFLRTSDEMAAHYADRPELLEATLRVAESCEDDVMPGRARLPSLFPDDDHPSPRSWSRRRTRPMATASPKGIEGGSPWRWSGSRGWVTPPTSSSRGTRRAGRGSRASA